MRVPVAVRNRRIQIGWAGLGLAGNMVTGKTATFPESFKSCNLQSYRNPFEPPGQGQLTTTVEDSITTQRPQYLNHRRPSPDASAAMSSTGVNVSAFCLNPPTPPTLH